MSSQADTPKEVALLLGELAGATVHALDSQPEFARYEIEIATAEALGELSRICQGANAAFSPAEVAWPPRGQQANVRFPVFISIVAARASDGEVLEEGVLQAFAIHLVWRLARRGEIPMVRANQLLDRWHGARVVV